MAKRPAPTKLYAANSQIAQIEYTSNFEANLHEIAEVWLENAFIAGYDRLLEHLLVTIVPSLERHPSIGKPFSSHKVDSVEVQIQLENIRYVRELVFEDYVLMYLLEPAADASNQIIQLLAIKHHKQLSFRFRQSWNNPETH